MKNNDERKYIPEISQKEIQELRKSIKSASIKVMTENIERMRKTSANRPEAMQYFDEIANFFGQREKEIQEAKQKGTKVIGYFCNFAQIEPIHGGVSVAVS